MLLPVLQYDCVVLYIPCSDSDNYTLNVIRGRWGEGVQGATFG
jgi:hypothetical protein